MGVHPAREFADTEFVTWLKRWEEREQRAFDGVISENDLRRWRWTRESDGTLRYRRTVLDDRGVHYRSLRRRSWPWAEVAYLTWEVVLGGNASLVVCVTGDPWVKRLSNTGFLATHNSCRALLEDAREFVEQHGAHIRATTDPAAWMWWPGQPEAKRKS